MSPADVLVLEAVYYGAIVGLEVPSGWFSDRLGRRITLVLSGLGWTGGALCMLVASSLPGFIAGQVLFAAGRAFASGTDSALLYETLSGLGRADEHRERESRATSINFAALALGSLIGGAVGMVSLRAPYALSVAGGVVATIAAAFVVEPSHEQQAPTWRVQVDALRSALGVTPVRWVLGAMVAFVVFSHVPYELQQPWLDGAIGGSGTPLISGIVVAVAMTGASIGSRFASRIAAAVGAKAAILLGMGLVALVMAGMAWGSMWWVVPLLMLRSVPTGLVNPLATSIVHPHLSSTVRATYLSAQSLLGRLAFAVALLLASRAVGETWTTQTLSSVLVPAMVACLGCVALLAVLPLERRRG